MTLREKLEALAELRDWSIRKVAKNAGIPQQTLSSAMDGSSLRIEAAMAVAKLMDVPTDWLFDAKLGWGDLEKMPFYTPKGVDPGTRVSVFRDASREADKLVDEKHGSAAVATSRKSAKRAGTGRRRKGA